MVTLMLLLLFVELLDAAPEYFSTGQSSEMTGVFKGSFNSFEICCDGDMKLKKKITKEMIVFGSFSEEEIRSLQNKAPEKSEVPVGKKGLQFGSLPFVLGALLSDANGETAKRPASSVKSSNSVKKDAGSVLSKDVVPGSGNVSKENGSVHDCEHFFPLANGRQHDKDVNPGLGSECFKENDGIVSSPL